MMRGISTVKYNPDTSVFWIGSLDIVMILREAEVKMIDNLQFFLIP